MPSKSFASVLGGVLVFAFAAVSGLAAPPSSLPNSPALQASPTPTSTLTPAPISSRVSTIIWVNNTSTPTATATLTSTLPPGQGKIAQAIADHFGMDVGDVEDLHDELHGWGQVFMALWLADKFGADPEDIVAMRKDGKGWGPIIMSFGFKPGLKSDNLGGAISGRITLTDTLFSGPSHPSGTPTPRNPGKKKGLNPDSKGKGPMK